jgi:transcriptional regulator
MSPPYNPPVFAVTDTPRCVEFARANSFATLVSNGDDGPLATHLPLLIDVGADGGVEIVGHMARANPHWKQAGGQKVLAIFSGPHAYVSASVYQAENVVPTWNYMVVHASGLFHAIEDVEQNLSILQRTVAFYEQNRPQPWSFDSASAYHLKLTESIVGFRIRVETLSGKFKLSQNQSLERQQRVAESLLTSGIQIEHDVALQIYAQSAFGSSVKS